MRILHIIDEPYDSGIVQYALSVASGLDGRGHASRIWALEGRYPSREAASRGLEVRTFKRPWIELRALRRDLKERKVDLVVAHTGSAHTLAIAATAWHATGSSAPVIRTRGDARPVKRRPGGRALWGRTAGFIAANGRILDEFEKAFSPSRIPRAVIYEGREDPGPAAPASDGAPVLGIVARLDPVKGHEDLLQAFSLAQRECPEARLRIIGREENLSIEELRARANASGIGGRVEFTGHVPDALEEMRSCHVGVIASRGSEAVSRAAVEWMAVGKPLIATRVGCLPEYVVDGKTGFLVPPGDPEAMAGAMKKLAGDPYIRERCGREARARFESVFGLERFLDETERLYGETIHSLSSR